VLIDGDYLLLIRGELFCVALDSVGSSAWSPGVLLVWGVGSYILPLTQREQHVSCSLSPPPLNPALRLQTHTRLGKSVLGESYA
jgi:hypothetical protein